MKHKKQYDQCSWMRVNGIFIHEQGCPNDDKTWHEGEWVLFLECDVCGYKVREG